MLKGVTAHPAWTDDPTCAWWQPWAEAVRALGLDFVRFDLNWQDPDVLQKCSSIISLCGTLRPVVTLAGAGPTWAEPIPEDYAAVAAEVARLLPVGGVLEVWNEPNITPNFWPSPASPERYALLAQHANDAVKAVARHVIVAAPSIAFGDRGFLESFLRQAPRSFDWLSTHPYTLGLTAPPDDPDAAHDGWNSYRATLDMFSAMQQGYGLDFAPVMISEVGWPVADAGPSHYRAALWLARAVGVVAFGAFNLGDHPAERNAYSLLAPDRTPTLAARVLAEA